jgi:hypothetical protein
MSIFVNVYQFFIGKREATKSIIFVTKWKMLSRVKDFHKNIFAA